MRGKNVQEFKDPFAPRVDSHLSAHPLGQTPHEAYDVFSRLADQAQREALSEVREIPVRFEEDEELQKPRGRVGGEEERAARGEGRVDQVCASI